MNPLMICRPLHQISVNCGLNPLLNLLVSNHLNSSTRWGSKSPIGGWSTRDFDGWHLTMRRMRSLYLVISGCMLGCAQSFYSPHKAIAWKGWWHAPYFFSFLFFPFSHLGDHSGLSVSRGKSRSTFRPVVWRLWVFFCKIYWLMIP